jgi:hypothetical protein
VCVVTLQGPSIIPQKHQDKKLISQDEEGSYVIHDAILAILDKARELKIMQNAISPRDMMAT